MKMTHVLLGAGAIVAGYVIYEHFFTPHPTVTTPRIQPSRESCLMDRCT